MPTQVDALLANLREKRDAALRQAVLYASLLQELEGALRTKAAPRRKTAGRPRSRKRKPLKAAVSASDAILRLLAGCRMGLPGSEIIHHVAATYGHRPHSLRTTLHTLKKKGAIVRAEDGTYNHPQNVG